MKRRQSRGLSPRSVPTELLSSRFACCFSYSTFLVRGASKGIHLTVQVVLRASPENYGLMLLTNFMPLVLPQSQPITANATNRNAGADGSERLIVMCSTRPTPHDERRGLVRWARNFDIDMAALFFEKASGLWGEFELILLLRAIPRTAPLALYCASVRSSNLLWL